MQLEDLAYRPEEELTDAELELRLRNISEHHHRNVKLAYDEHASAKQRRAACLLDSVEISYYQRLRWIARAEVDKRRYGRRLSLKQAKLLALREADAAASGSMSRASDERSLVEEIEILRKSIKSEANSMKSERAFIEDHRDELNDSLTIIGLGADDDIRPPGMTESVKESISKKVVRGRVIKGSSGESRTTDRKDCDLVTNPPPQIWIDGKQYYLSSVPYAEEAKLTDKQYEAVILRFGYGVEEDTKCAKFLGIDRASYTERLEGALKKIDIAYKTNKGRKPGLDD